MATEAVTAPPAAPATTTSAAAANTATVTVPAPAAATTTAPAASATPAATPAAEPAKPAAAAAPWMAPAADPAKPEAAQPAPDAKPKEDVKYELKAPDGVTLDAAALEGYVSFAKENGLTPAQAQKILDRDVASKKADNESLMAQVKEIDQKNLSAIQTAWGDKFGEYSEDTKRAFDHVDPDGSLRREMESVGVAHHKPLVEAFRKFGALLKNASLRSPSTAGPSEKDGRSTHERNVDYYRQKMEEQRRAAAARK